MTKKLFIVFSLTLIICFSNYGCSHNDKIAKGNDIAGKIETFISKNGKLPNSLSEIGIEEKKADQFIMKRKVNRSIFCGSGKS